MIGDFSDELLYLPYIAVFVLSVYFSVLIVCGVLFDTKDYSIFVPHRFRKRHRKKNCLSCAQLCSDLWRCCCCCTICSEYYFCGVPLPLFRPQTLRNNIPCLSKHARYILLFTRIISCLFMAYYVIASYSSEAQSVELNKFSAWNNILCGGVFFLLSLASIFGIFTLLCRRNGNHFRSQWPIVFQRLAVLLHYGYECCMSNAVFITIMEYAYLQYFQEEGRNYDLTFTNVKYHLIPTGLLVWESAFNIIPFRLEHYYLSLSLPVAYLVFQWVLVVTEERDWQYSFLRTDRATCFSSYALLFGTHFSCYFGVWLLMLGRDRLYGLTYDKSYRIIREELDEFDVDNRNEDEQAHDIGSNVEFSDVYASNDQGMFIGSFDEINLETQEEGSSPSAPVSSRVSSRHGILSPSSLPPIATNDLPMATPVTDATTVPSYRVRV